MFLHRNKAALEKSYLGQAGWKRSRIVWNKRNYILCILQMLNKQQKKSKLSLVLFLPKMLLNRLEKMQMTYNHKQTILTTIRDVKFNEN